jgi:hypothetical protein
MKNPNETPRNNNSSNSVLKNITLNNLDFVKVHSQRSDVTLRTIKKKAAHNIMYDAIKPEFCLK